MVHFNWCFTQVSVYSKHHSSLYSSQWKSKHNNRFQSLLLFFKKLLWNCYLQLWLFFSQNNVTCRVMFQLCVKRLMNCVFQICWYSVETQTVGLKCDRSWSLINLLICGILNVTVSSSDYAASDELERKRTKYYSQHVPWGTMENHKKPQSKFTCKSLQYNSFFLKKVW